MNNEFADKIIENQEALRSFALMFERYVVLRKFYSMEFKHTWNEMHDLLHDSHPIEDTGNYIEHWKYQADFSEKLIKRLADSTREYSEAACALLSWYQEMRNVERELNQYSHQIEQNNHAASSKESTIASSIKDVLFNFSNIMRNIQDQAVHALGNGDLYTNINLIKADIANAVDVLEVVAMLNEKASSQQADESNATISEKEKTEPVEEETVAETETSAVEDNTKYFVNPGSGVWYYYDDKDNTEPLEKATDKVTSPEPSLLGDETKSDAMEDNRTYWLSSNTLYYYDKDNKKPLEETTDEIASAHIPEDEIICIIGDAIAPEETSVDNKKNKKRGKNEPKI